MAIGAKFDCSPDAGATDFVQLCQTAAHCNGATSESPQLQFALEMLSHEIKTPNYRATSANDFPLRSWLRLFDGAQHNKDRLEEQLHELRNHQNDIRPLLVQRARHITVAKYMSKNLFDALQAVKGDVESTRGLSIHEFKLIWQICMEQQRCGRVWASSAVVTTILYNLVASQNEF